jgi:hypothetical protein
MSVLPVVNRPSIVRLAAPSMAILVEVSAEAGVPLQSDAAYTLLACLPVIGEWPRQPCRMVAGKVGAVLRFSGSKAEWVESSLAEATAAKKGFFRIKRDWDSVSILKLTALDCAYIDDRAGRLAAAARHRHATWNAGSRSFSLPVRLVPPAAIARALTLCTGELPHFDRASRRVEFAGVRPATARLALAITGLRLV